MRAAVFDMDGVVTRTASLHAAAWKRVFDGLLRHLAGPGATFLPFDEKSDYLAYVDGKPRRDGVSSFLHARNIELPRAEQEDIAARKDKIFEQLLQEKGVQVFPSTLALIKTMRAHDVRIAMVTSSRHGREIIQRAGIAELFDACLDGTDLESLSLRGKPDPDMFLHAAEQLHAAPMQAMVVEDAVAGVQAGRRGGFALVLGVDRGGNAEALAQAGADIVVQDLAETSFDRLQAALFARQESMAWCVEQEGFDRARERQMESLFAVGNGYLGLRGALDTPIPASQPDLFIAGVYDAKRPETPRPETEFLTPGHEGDPYAELVPFPFPLRLEVTVDGIALDFDGDHGRELRRILDLRHGVLRIEAGYETPGGRRTTIRTRRCASLADPHLLLQEAVATAENHWSPIEIEASQGIADWALRHPHLTLLEQTKVDGTALRRYATRASGFQISVASRASYDANRMRRVVCIYTSRDVDDPRAAALAHVEKAAKQDFDSMLDVHAKQWAAFWDRADVRVPGRPAVEQALRFNSYHLRLPLADDPRVSVGARTLTGRAYEGHVFWDTEIFMLPFYLHVDPARARNLLLYRHGTLDGARRHARELHGRGACFAWESTVTGDDVTPTEILIKSSGTEIPVFTGKQQLHITADVAYAVWRYCEATADDAFLAGCGADILFETARFWASRVERGAQHYHIRCVVGPDEYHHSVNDNAYTNWMARFNLERAAWLAKHLAINPGEADEWDGIAQSLYVPSPGKDGIIEQFEGFFSLGDFTFRQEERDRAPVSRLLDWEKINRLKVVKQADVLMLPFLFPDAFSDEVVAANYHYYEPLTDHGSSLSPSVHAAIAARIGAREDAERYWKRSLWLDLTNSMNNSTLGVHPAAMGGTWQALVFGMLGVHFDGAAPKPDACAPERLPDWWRRVALSMMVRGQCHQVSVSREDATRISQ